MASKRIDATYPDGDIESGNQAKNIKRQSNIASHNTKRSFVGKFTDGAALEHPRFSESNVAKTDTAPDEEVAETTQAEQPGKDSAFLCALTNESKQTKQNLKNNSID